MNEKFNLIVCQIIVVFVSIFTVACAKMDGYCASIAVDAGASQSILNGVNAFGSGSFNFSTMNPAMLPALYDNINMNLYQTFGYDVNDAIDYGADNLTSWATGQRDNPLNGASTISVSTADWLASKLLQAGATASSVLNTGYEYFAQSIPQWGENAKQFFIGKKNEVTGAIESAGANVVTKITAGGLVAYNQIYSNLVDTGEIDRIDSRNCVNTKYFRTNGIGGSSSYIISSNLYFSQPTIIYTGHSPTSGRYRLYLLVPRSIGTYSGDNFNFSDSYVSGNFVDGRGHEFPIQNAILVGPQFVTINGIEYAFGTLNLNNGYYPATTYPFGDLESAKELVGTSSSTTISYDYSTNEISQTLKNQLDRLIGKYVDSLTLQRVNDILSSIPIGVEEDIPVAIPTQEVVDELTDVIDDAITDSATYEEVFDAYYEDAIDVPSPPDPEPVIPDYTGTLVPTPFPDDTFSPINGGINSLFSMASLFEPIFYVFSAFSGLFSLWLVVPFVLLFGILIRLLK